MFRNLMVAVAAAVLVTPFVASAHDDEFESDWGWIDDGAQVEEYDFEGDVSVDMAAPGASVSFDTFHDGLTPYGEWVTVGAYGRVWRPAGVATGWRPYYHGRWEWTDEGWLWVSAEPWGWATYHYGRWAHDSFYGWVWVPGYQWAPAWVSWRFGAEYIGWAPLGPGLSVYVTNYPVVYDRWCFVPSARFVGVPVHTVAYVGPRVRPIYSRTQPAPPRATVHGAVAPAWGGPARPFVERRVGRPIAPVRVQPVASPSAIASAPSRQGVVPVYRPEAAARPSRAAPSRSSASAPGRATTAPGRAITAPGRREDSSMTAPSRQGTRGSSTAAPARPGAARRDAPSAAPPAAAPAPRSRSNRVESGGSGRGGASSAPAVAPPSRRGSSGGGGSVAAPSRGGGASRGGGVPRSSGGAGGGGGRGSGHAVPGRR